jgi:hypothetical protein
MKARCANSIGKLDSGGVTGFCSVTPMLTSVLAFPNNLVLSENWHGKTEFGYTFRVIIVARISTIDDGIVTV